MKCSEMASSENKLPLMSSGTNGTFKFLSWLKRDQRKESRVFPIDKSCADRGLGKGRRLRKHISNPKPIGRPLRFDGGDAVLDLIDQAAKVVHDVEARASETERYTRIIAEAAVKTLKQAMTRIRELEAELESSRTKPPPEAQTKIPEDVARPGIMTLVARAREKITAMNAYSRPNKTADAMMPSISDQGLSNIGWTEILARADAALSEADTRSQIGRFCHKNRGVSQKAA
jgi:hypothetical protein